MPRPSRLGFLLAALLLLAPPVAAQQHAPSGYDEGTFELVAQGLPSLQLTVLVSPRGKFLLPLRVMLDYLAVPYTIVPDSATAHVTRPGGVGTASIRWATTARGLVVDKLTPLDSDDVVRRADELFVSAPRMAELVEGAIDVDMATLMIRASRAGGYPAQVRVDVHTRRLEELRRAASEAARPAPFVPFIPRTGFGVVEWAVGGLLSPLQTPSTVETRVGLDLWGGMLDAHGVLGLPGTGGSLDASGRELSYRRVFPTGTWLRQLQLGDVLSEGAEARSIRGVTLSNAPYVRSLSFGDLPFSRPLPPGWEYEVFEGDRLVGYADAATRTPLNVPLQYGTTPLRVKLYGPAGEVVESAVSYVIPIEQLRDGEWQYATGAGRCALQQCSAMSYGEVRHGLTSTLTLQGGVDQVRDTSVQVVRPYGALSWLPAPGWSASVQARRAAYVRGSLQNMGEGDITGGMTAGFNSPGQGGIAVSNDSDAVWYTESALRLAHALPILGDRSLSLSTRLEGHQHGGGHRWDITGTVPTRDGLLDVGIASDPLAGVSGEATGRPLVRVAPTFSLARSRLAWLGSPVLRVETGFQGTDLAQWELALSLQPGHGFANVSLRRLAGSPGRQLVVGGSFDFGAGRTLMRLGSAGGHVEGGYSATGAVAFGGVRRAVPLEYGGLGLAGVEGLVYRDVNGDGVFDAGDVAIRNVTVQVGGLRTTTDSLGRYSLWNALPYEALAVQVDSLSLEDPSWTPVLGTHALRPSPQQFTRIDFPLVHTREIVGSVVAAAPLPAGGGVALELRGEGSGALYATRTFSDGAFYLSRVRPGRYQLTVVASSLKALGAATPAPREVVVGGEGDDVMELPPLVLTAAPRGP